MEKLKLIGIGSGDKRSYFIIEKDELIDPFLIDFFKQCGIDDYLKYSEYHLQNRDIFKAIDIVEHSRNEQYDVDIVYGKDLVFLIVRYQEEKDRDFITSLVLEYCEFKSSDVTAESKKKTGQQVKINHKNTDNAEEGGS